MKGYFNKLLRGLKTHKGVVAVALMITLMVATSVITSVSSHAACNCATCQLLNRYYLMGYTTNLMNPGFQLDIDSDTPLIHDTSSLEDAIDDGIDGTTFKVITQNLRVNSLNDGWDNTLQKRQPRIEQVLEEYAADVYCFQECSTDWKPYADRMMPSSEFESVFMKTNVGHCNPVYVRKSTCTVIESDSFFISDINPEDYDENRVASWAIVKKNNSDKTMLIVNAHLPVTNNTQDDACQRIMDFIKTKNVDGYLICGDFNFTKEGNQAAYTIMTAEGTKDMEMAVAEEGTVGETGPTFHNYGKRENPIKIDYFFGSDSVLSTKYSVIKDKVDGLYLSDHYGIYQEATIK